MNLLKSQFHKIIQILFYIYFILLCNRRLVIQNLFVETRSSIYYIKRYSCDIYGCNINRAFVGSNKNNKKCKAQASKCRSQWPRGLRRRSSAARLLRLWVRIPPRAWMFVCCECFVLSGRGLCDGLITRPEQSYRLWRVFVCDHETSKTRRLNPATGL